jgi:adenine-specific DNA-methyltransferase
LQTGENKNLHLRYLTSHRPLWYLTERRPPAPILVNVFTRSDLRLLTIEQTL